MRRPFLCGVRSGRDPAGHAFAPFASLRETVFSDRASSYHSTTAANRIAQTNSGGVVRNAEDASSGRSAESRTTGGTTPGLRSMLGRELVVLGERTAS
jgi:hypothetical protein